MGTTRNEAGGRNDRAGGRDRAPRRGVDSDGAPPAIAALDLGTNNCRLLVARPEGESFVVIDAFSRAVRLGEGLGEGVEHSNQLGSAAQNRALKALRICAAKIRRHRVTDARIIATAACRRAVNGAGFIRRVTREVGLQMEIISAEEEARLAVAGCAPLIDPEAEQLLVFDIGGGSTELIWIDMSRTPPGRRVSLIRTLAPTGANGAESANARAAANHIADWISVPMGVSTLHERFVSIADARRRFAAMSEHFEQHLAPFIPYQTERRAALTRRLQIIGVSGTATTFGALHLGLRSYDRGKVDGLWLPRERATELTERMLSLGAGRAADPEFGSEFGGGIGPGRAELMLSGAAILMTILRAWPVARLRIADRGLREGMLYGLLQQRRIAAQ
ncbi:MAG: Ppx/GppA family phosphatase [Proteobacteria bacterium]|nr:Ppx/GppA family phosphatase [Pseudomonadota bacterium]